MTGPEPDVNGERRHVFHATAPKPSLHVMTCRFAHRLHESPAVMPDTKTCAGSSPGSRAEATRRPSPLEDERRKMIDNARWKCLAAWLNIMSAGTVFIGLVTPIFHMLSVRRAL